MKTAINTMELLKILEMTPPEQNIMLVGKHGIGKSEIISGYFIGLGQKVTALFLGQMSDPGDLLGLPALDPQSARTEFRPPWWFPVDGKPVVLFLDELNRARPEILQAVMDLVLNKRLAGRMLPAGSRIVSAVNEGEEYQLTDLDPALVSRFNIYWFSPTPAEWLLWAANNGVDARVTKFIEQHNEFLDAPANEDAELEKSYDRRSWKRVSDMIAKMPRIDKTTEKAIAGIVGDKAAYLFFSTIEDSTLFNGREVLQGFAACKAHLESLKTHELSSLHESMFRTLETEDDEKVIAKYMGNLLNYIKWLKASGRTEVLAHWVTLYNTPTYPKTMVAIINKAPELFAIINDFIQQVKL
jgi:MoxR-like ATPase